MNCRHEAMKPDDAFCRTCGVSREALLLNGGEPSKESRPAVPAAQSVSPQPSAGGAGSRTATIFCGNCGAGVVGEAADHQYTCSGCGFIAVLARCPSCSHYTHIGSTLWGHSVECPACGISSGWRGWRSRVTLSEFASELDIDQGAAADLSRRVVSGMVLGGSGFPIAAGGACMLEFAREAVYVKAVLSRSQSRIVGIAEYSEVVTLQVGGPGVVTTGGGWIGGGFGLTGIATGVLLADAMNRLTTRSTIETIIHFGTTAGVLVVFNNVFTPEQLAVMLSPVINRIESAQRKPVSSSQTSVQQLRELAQLRADGTITEDEFRRLKAAIIASSGN